MPCLESWRKWQPEIKVFLERSFLKVYVQPDLRRVCSIRMKSDVKNILAYGYEITFVRKGEPTDIVLLERKCNFENLLTLSVYDRHSAGAADG